MKKLYNFSVAMALLILCAISVKAQNPDVYVGGILNIQAAIWENEVPRTIDGSEVNTIVTVGEDFYIAGLDKDYSPVVWKNDELLYSLNEGDYNYFGRSVSSMIVHEGDVYVTTIDLISSGFIGRLWVNGVVVEGYEDAIELYAVVIDGDDIYVAGRTNELAVIWKNAEPLYTYDSPYTGLFADVKVVDGDVYYVGGDFGGGAGKNATIKSKDDVIVNQDNNRNSINVWKNGEVIYTLANEVYGAKIVVSDGNVYACGQIPNGGVYKAVVWINGEMNIITDVWSGAHGLCVYNNDLYVTGFMGNDPELDAFIWKNGELSTLTSPGYDMGYCILVMGDNTSVEEINDYCNIYPNPADDYVLIEGVEFEKAVLYNSLGQLVLTTTSNRIDVSSLESGLYLLKLDDNITRNIIVKH
ncbi:MAG: T9SS type A sorting domain-containing protein [Bacteroidales bacterium]|nr:T9SS type A sorting domain-containing protein [Bacteroidales bacterium]